jgi:DNA-binding FadR family transcriptional regulator
MMDNYMLVNLLDIRIKLEIAYIEEAITKSTFKQIEELKKLLIFMEDKIIRGEEVIKEDMEFHLLLYKNVDNDIFKKLDEVFWKIYLKTREEKDPDKKTTLNYHKKIFEAFVMKDIEKAKISLIKHYGLRERLLK